MSHKSRVLFANAHLFSHIAYGAPLFFDESADMNNKYHQLFMKCVRFANVSYGFKKSCKKLCENVDRKESQEEAFSACAVFTHKIIHHKKPRKIIGKIRFPRSRPNAELGLLRAPRLKIFKNTFINRIPTIYKAIPNELKHEGPITFRRKLKKIKIRKPHLY